MDRQDRSINVNLSQRIFKWLGGVEENPVEEVLATLVLAARDDEAFRKRVLLVLALPDRDRESMVRTAVEEMALRGEPLALRTAFLTLASPEGAAAAAKALESTS